MGCQAELVEAGMPDEPAFDSTSTSSVQADSFLDSVVSKLKTNQHETR